jgi:hypothetical protein
VAVAVATLSEGDAEGAAADVWRMNMVLAHALAQPRARVRRLTVVAALAALGLYVLAVDQGLALSLVQGDLAFDQNLIHELMHDGRHALAVPCH